MAWNVKNVIDYSASGDDIDSFSLKVKNEEEVIYELLNRLRTFDASPGANVADAVAYSVHVDTSTTPPTIYMRDSTNTKSIPIGKLADNFGIDAASVGGVRTDGFGKLNRGTEADLPTNANSYDVFFATDTSRIYMYMSGAWRVFASLNANDILDMSNAIVQTNEVAASGAGKIPRLDPDTGEGQFSITGSAAKIQNYPLYTPGLSDDQVLAFNATKKQWENKGRTEGVVTNDEVSTGEAGKVVRTTSKNEANISITGNAAKIANKTVDVENLTAGDGLVYDSVKDEMVNRPVVTLNSAGSADIDITGTAAKISGRSFNFQNLEDGQIPVYRESANGFVNENKSTVGAGKALTINLDDVSVGEYDGSTRVVANIETPGLRKNVTAYEVGATAKAKGLAPNLYLECTVAGKTGDSEPDMTSATVDSIVVDGAATWIVRRVVTSKDLSDHNESGSAHVDIRTAIAEYCVASASEPETSNAQIWINTTEAEA